MGKKVQGGITFPKGFQANGLNAGIKSNRKPDLALIVSEVDAESAGLFTVNRIKAAPVRLSQRRIRFGQSRAILVNSGNANACTGDAGMQDALQLTEKVSQFLNCNARKILCASTGVIGRPLPVNNILEAIPKLVDGASPYRNLECATAIMTTDTYPKEAQGEFPCNGETVRIGGIAKGVGMIHPQMATMLVFLTTDASISRDALRSALQTVVDRNFHALSVDGETSTNDSVMILANGCAENPKIQKGTSSYADFLETLDRVCQKLRELLVHDGEGATKFIRISVQGARSRTDAKKVAASIAKSILVKTAFFGEDVNWGRIMVAIGNAGATIREEKIDISFGDVALVHQGVGMGESQEEKALEVMKGKEIHVFVSLGMGPMTAEYWTTDMSYEYVRINAGYKGRT
ncbi:Glutamate N-acetyltransferase / N-acetylglutamate synthase [Leptospirillum ferriphilum]|uniref:Arginine biosynthesis bifunctional protein ArgJ n=1 Tax=Leptospirillum ferriphilum TaxID=178606 RepID=A0A094YN60_9BACT|nr:bifunctional glutamate N-acetyltransferase/amino-acid acetyltransferase ArgJ [Leptospirillum ferriphilum]KGA94676.1 Glutamate N-acetyltransferase / N-acetylglutamate synthase [Leptospirillum ferriphilum]